MPTADNLALRCALQNSDQVRAVFFVTRGQWQSHNWSARRIEFTSQALRALQADLAQLGVNFRILSPVRQPERFDPAAEFIKTYVPELRELPAKTIHKPGHPELLARGYPAPMVDLKAGKERCLSAFQFALAE